MSFHRHLVCSIALIFLFVPMAQAQDSQSQKSLNTAMMEMNGRGCYGYFQVTPRYIDFYTPFLDCHKMRYSNLSQSEQPVLLEDKSYNSVSLTIDQPTQSCPFVAIEVLSLSEKNEYSSRQILGYSSQEEFKKFRWGVDQSTGNYVGSSELLACTAYPLKPHEKARLKPERRRVKPQVHLK